MRLSEAIRLGSMMGPQARGSLTRKRRTGFLGIFGSEVTEYCAIGAAHAAVGARYVTYSAKGGEDKGVPFRGAKVVSTTRKAGEKYSVIEGDNFDCDPSYKVVACPACTKVNGELFRIIPHLNDDHKWTREHIADFVSRFEPSLESASSDDAVARGHKVSTT